VAVVFCFVALVGRASGPRVIIEVLCSEVDRNLGLQSDLGDLIVTNSIIFMPRISR
jgi:hypothetical protein